MSVYFIRNATTGNYKIGFSKNPLARKRDLQVASDAPLELILVIDGDQAMEFELHRRFDQHRIRGEWFAPHQDLLDWITAQALRHEAVEFVVELRDGLVDELSVAYKKLGEHIQQTIDASDPDGARLVESTLADILEICDLMHGLWVSTSDTVKKIIARANRPRPAGDQ